MRYFLRHLRTKYILVPPGVNPLEYQESTAQRFGITKWWVIGWSALFIVAIGIALGGRQKAAAQAQPTLPPAEIAAYNDAPAAFDGPPPKDRPTYTPTSTLLPEDLVRPLGGYYPPTQGSPAMAVTVPVIVKETVIVEKVVEKSVPGPAQRVEVTRLVAQSAGSSQSGQQPIVREILATVIVVYTATPGPTQTPWLVTPGAGTPTDPPTNSPTQTPHIITATPGPTQTPWIHIHTATPGPTQTPWVVTATTAITPTITFTPTITVPEWITPTLPYTPTLTATPTLTFTEVITP